MRTRETPPRQQEILINLEKGWFIIHSPFQNRPYWIVRLNNGVREERPIHKAVVKTLIHKGLIELTGMHGNQARYDIKN